MSKGRSRHAGEAKLKLAIVRKDPGPVVLAPHALAIERTPVADGVVEAMDCARAAQDGAANAHERAHAGLLAGDRRVVPFLERFCVRAPGEVLDARAVHAVPRINPSVAGLMITNPSLAVLLVEDGQRGNWIWFLDGMEKLE